MEYFHIANILKPAFDLPLDLDIVIELDETDPTYIPLIKEGLLVMDSDMPTKNQVEKRTNS